MNNRLEIEAIGLNKSFGGKKVLDGLDLSIERGQMVGLIGPNGAGKTTLFRILLELIEADGGSIGRRTDIDRIGYMTQAEALYAGLTVKENVTFFGRLFGLHGKRLEQAVEQAIELVALQERGDSLVAHLSGGMRRRTALATAVVHSPDLMLLDEPTVGIDPELRANFWEQFRQWASEGTTIVVSTHNLDEAIRCSALGLMKAGKLIAKGSPEELMMSTNTTSIEQAFLAFSRGDK